MALDLYSVVYHIAANFLPYLGLSVFMMLFLCWMLSGTIRNYLFVRRLRRAASLYLDEHKPRPDYRYARLEPRA